MRAVPAVMLLAFAALAGCTAPGEPTPDTLPPVTLLAMEGATKGAGEALEWQGAWLVYSPGDERRCGPANCEIRQFTLAPLSGSNWTLQVTLDWADSHNANTGDWDPNYPSFNMTLRGPDGAIWFHPGLKFGNAIHVDNPAAGAYELEVHITHMIRDWALPPFLGQSPPIDPVLAPIAGTYEGRVLVAQRAAAASGPLLPDLLVRGLDGLRIEYSAPGQGHGFFPDAWLPTTAGCTAGENQESDAQRCLRFSVAIGNDGAGPLALDAMESDDPTIQARQRMGLETIPAVQCVVDSAGNGTVREAGTATFSSSHNHMHFDNILGYALFSYDVANATRGDEVATGSKLGYGPWPQALVHDGRQLAAPPEVPDPCGLPSPDALDAGWYDYYLWWRTGQFIDVAGLPDGVYELVASMNPMGNILEEDVTNNAGSVVLRLAGNEVEVLQPFMFGKS